MKAREIKRLRDYVTKDNELDIQMKQVHKTLSKYGMSQENVEKDVARLRIDSHPPVFLQNDYQDIINRLTKIEEILKIKKE